MPKVFISYSWDSEKHKAWVCSFAERLRADGVDTTLDQWHLVPGDQMPEFMEKSIRKNDFVLIICTPHYKEKSDDRTGGVGYEGDIMTAEIFSKSNHRKFIPVLREGEWNKASPSWLLGKYRIDLRGKKYSETQYKDLLITIHGTRPQAPPVGSIPLYKLERPFQGKAEISSSSIKIEGILVDEVTIPKNDGTPGSALYAIPFKLSHVPSTAWRDLFVANWDRPPQFTTMHRPGIARISRDRIILDGTTIEEVEKYHRDTLQLVVKLVNRIVEKQEKELSGIKERKIKFEQDHKNKIRDASRRIKFE